MTNLLKSEVATSKQIVGVWSMWTYVDAKNCFSIEKLFCLRSIYSQLNLFAWKNLALLVFFQLLLREWA